MRQLVGEDLCVLLRGEVVVLLAPAADRVDDAGDELADRGLTLRRAERASEVLLGDDVGGVLRPADGKLHAALLEGVPALLEVGDDRVARLPFDLVERVGPLRREMPPERQPLPVFWPDHLHVLQAVCRLRHLRRPPLGGRITPVESQGCNTAPEAHRCQVPFSYIWWDAPTSGHNILWLRADRCGEAERYPHVAVERQWTAGGKPVPVALVGPDGERVATARVASPAPA
jgi:hypothetical protein